VQAPLFAQLVEPARQRRRVSGEIKPGTGFSVPSISPLDPSATTSTSGGPGSDVKIICDFAARDWGLSAHLALALRCGVAELSCMSCTTNW